MRFFLISLFLISAQIFANPLLDHADLLFQNDQFDLAITEYKRFLFFHSDDKKINEITHKIGLAYRSLGDLENAITTFRSVKNNTPIRLDLAVTYLANDQPELALLELIRIEKSPRSQFLIGVANTQLFRWNSAEIAFQNYFGDDYKKLKPLTDLAKNRSKKSPKIARRLSTILPGSGQIYAGNLENAINAFGLNSLIAFGCYRLARSKNYSDASLLFLTIFWRYYNGNRYNAAQITEDRNRREDQLSADKILQKSQDLLKNRN